MSSRKDGGTAPAGSASSTATVGTLSPAAASPAAAAADAGAVGASEAAGAGNVAVLVKQDMQHDKPLSSLGEQQQQGVFIGAVKAAAPAGADGVAEKHQRTGARGGSCHVMDSKATVERMRHKGSRWPEGMPVLNGRQQQQQQQCPVGSSTTNLHGMAGLGSSACRNLASGIVRSPTSALLSVHPSPLAAPLPTSFVPSPPASGYNLLHNRNSGLAEGMAQAKVARVVIHKPPKAGGARIRVGGRVVTGAEAEALLRKMAARDAKDKGTLSSSAPAAAAAAGGLGKQQPLLYPMEGMRSAPRVPAKRTPKKLKLGGGGGRAGNGGRVGGYERPAFAAEVCDRDDDRTAATFQQQQCATLIAADVRPLSGSGFLKAPLASLSVSPKLVPAASLPDGGADCDLMLLDDDVNDPHALGDGLHDLMVELAPGSPWLSSLSPDYDASGPSSSGNCSGIAPPPDLTLDDVDMLLLEGGSSGCAASLCIELAEAAARSPAAAPPAVAGAAEGTTGDVGASRTGANSSRPKAIPCAAAAMPAAAPGDGKNDTRAVLESGTAGSFTGNSAFFVGSSTEWAIPEGRAVEGGVSGGLSTAGSRTAAEELDSAILSLGDGMGSDTPAWDDAFGEMLLNSRGPAAAGNAVAVPTKPDAGGDACRWVEKPVPEAAGFLPAVGLGAGSSGAAGGASGACPAATPLLHDAHKAVCGDAETPAAPAEAAVVMATAPSGDHGEGRQGSSGGDGSKQDNRGKMLVAVTALLPSNGTGKDSHDNPKDAAPAASRTLDLSRDLGLGLELEDKQLLSTPERYRLVVQHDQIAAAYQAGWKDAYISGYRAGLNAAAAAAAKAAGAAATVAAQAAGAAGVGSMGPGATGSVGPGGLVQGIGLKGAWELQQSNPRRDRGMPLPLALTRSGPQPQQRYLQEQESRARWQALHNQQVLGGASAMVGQKVGGCRSKQASNCVRIMGPLPAGKAGSKRAAAGGEAGQPLKKQQVKASGAPSTAGSDCNMTAAAASGAARIKAEVGAGGNGVEKVLMKVAAAAQGKPIPAGPSTTAKAAGSARPGCVGLLEQVLSTTPAPPTAATAAVPAAKKAASGTAAGVTAGRGGGGAGTPAPPTAATPAVPAAAGNAASGAAAGVTAAGGEVGVGEQASVYSSALGGLPPQNLERALLRSKLKSMTDQELWEVAAYMATGSKALPPPALGDAAPATSGSTAAAEIKGLLGRG